MNSILMEILYSTMVAVVPRTIAILIPLIGAFWIFKAREKAGSEGKIFELGREIANLLQSKDIRGPLEGISSYYIDLAKYKLNEQNHEKALNSLLKNNLFIFRHGQEPSEAERKESAEIILALATERWRSLVPSTVKWSGRGAFYNPYGEKIETDDTYFPFGTKLYREWIERFSDIYQDLWAITTNRQFFLESFFDANKGGGYRVSKASVEEWLDEIDARLKEIRPLHAKLLTHIQTIDTQIALPRLGRDIAILCFYMILLSIAGYFSPTILQLANLGSSAGLVCLAVVTIMLYAVIGIRLILAVQPIKDKHIQRRIFLPALIQELKEMERNFVRYRPHVIGDIISMRYELKLTSRLAVNLTRLSQKIQLFNEHASALYGLAYGHICEIGLRFPTSNANQSGFCINVADMVSDSFDFIGIKTRIIKENGNLEFSAQEIRSSRTILKINLSDLTKSQRLELCDCLDRIRQDLRESAPYAPTMKLFQEIQSLRKTSFAMLNKSVNVNS